MDPRILAALFLIALLSTASSAQDSFSDELTSDEDPQETNRTTRSIGNIARLLLGGNVPPDHPLVKYPDPIQTSASTSNKVIAAVPGMQGSRPTAGPSVITPFQQPVQQPIASGDAPLPAVSYPQQNIQNNNNYQPLQNNFLTSSPQPNYNNNPSSYNQPSQWANPQSSSGYQPPSSQQHYSSPGYQAPAPGPKIETPSPAFNPPSHNFHPTTHPFIPPTNSYQTSGNPYNPSPSGDPRTHFPPPGSISNGGNQNPYPSNGNTYNSPGGHNQYSSPPPNGYQTSNQQQQSNYVHGQSVQTHSIPYQTPPPSQGFQAPPPSPGNPHSGQGNSFPSGGAPSYHGSGHSHINTATAPSYHAPVTAPNHGPQNPHDRDQNPPQNYNNNPSYHTHTPTPIYNGSPQNNYDPPPNNYLAPSPNYDQPNNNNINYNNPHPHPTSGYNNNNNDPTVSYNHNPNPPNDYQHQGHNNYHHPSPAPTLGHNTPTPGYNPHPTTYGHGHNNHSPPPPSPPSGYNNQHDYNHNAPPPNHNYHSNQPNNYEHDSQNKYGPHPPPHSNPSPVSGENYNTNRRPPPPYTPAPSHQNYDSRPPPYNDRDRPSYKSKPNVLVAHPKRRPSHSGESSSGSRENVSYRDRERDRPRKTSGNTKYKGDYRQGTTTYPPFKSDYNGPSTKSYAPSKYSSAEPGGSKYGSKEYRPSSGRHENRSPSKDYSPRPRKPEYMARPPPRSDYITRPPKSDYSTGSPTSDYSTRPPKSDYSTRPSKSDYSTRPSSSSSSYRTSSSSHRPKPDYSHSSRPQKPYRSSKEEYRRNGSPTPPQIPTTQALKITYKVPVNSYESPKPTYKSSHTHYDSQYNYKRPKDTYSEGSDGSYRPPTPVYTSPAVRPTVRPQAPARPLSSYGSHAQTMRDTYNRQPQSSKYSDSGIKNYGVDGAKRTGKALPTTPVTTSPAKPKFSAQVRGQIQSSSAGTGLGYRPSRAATSENEYLEGFQPLQVGLSSPVEGFPEPNIDREGLPQRNSKIIPSIAVFHTSYIK